MYGCTNLRLHAGRLKGSLTEVQLAMLCPFSKRFEYGEPREEYFYTKQFSLPVVLAKVAWNCAVSNDCWWTHKSRMRLYLTTVCYGINTIPPKDRPRIAYVLGELRQFFEMPALTLSLRLFTSIPELRQRQIKPPH